MNVDDFDPDQGEAYPDHLFGLPHHPDDAQVVVVPVPFEATTSYGHGTSRAPRRVLEASQFVDLRDDWVGAPWRAGIAMLPIPEHIEALNARASALTASREGWGEPRDDADRALVAEVDAAGAQVNAWLHEQAAALFDQGKVPGVLGGDHSVSFGAIAAAKERVPGLGLLHIDAHADLREAYNGYAWSHASIIHNVWSRLGVDPIVSVGIRDYSPVEEERLASADAFHPVPDRRIREWGLSGRPYTELVEEILAPLPHDVWITFDVDGLEPALCPHTGTPVPGGLDIGQIDLLLSRLAATRRVVGFDLVEVGDGEWDANVAARLLFKLAGHAIHTNPRPR